ncbi:MAG: hypothetical protein AAFR54_08425 [Planctomycetota bacterium]
MTRKPSKSLALLAGLATACASSPETPSAGPDAATGGTRNVVENRQLKKTLGERIANAPDAATDDGFLSLPSLVERTSIHVLGNESNPMSERRLGQANDLLAASGAPLLEGDPRLDRSWGNALFRRDPLDPDSPSIFEGLAVDALSLGQDWMRIAWDEDLEEWYLLPFRVDGPTDLDAPPWAAILFREGAALRAVAWGAVDADARWSATLGPASVLRREVGPDRVPGDAYGDGTPRNDLVLLDYSDAIGADLSAMQGHELNGWHLIEDLRSSAPWVTWPERNEEPPLELGRRRWKGVPRVYFSVDGETESLDALAAAMEGRPRPDARWESGAAIFSYRLVRKRTFDGPRRWTWDGPFVEYVPRGRTDAGRGFDVDDDIDALVIDHGTGVVLASLDEESSERRRKEELDAESAPRVHSSFYAWGMWKNRSGPETTRSRPSPLRIWSASDLGYGGAAEPRMLLDDALRIMPAHAAVGVQRRGDPLPIVPKTGCADDPSRVRSGQPGF